MKQPNKFNSQLQQEILGSFQQLVKTLIEAVLKICASPLLSPRALFCRPERSEGFLGACALREDTVGCSRSEYPLCRPEA
jgi:hypothetical protein